MFLNFALQNSLKMGIFLQMIVVAHLYDKDYSLGKSMSG